MSCRANEEAGAGTPCSGAYLGYRGCIWQHVWACKINEISGSVAEDVDLARALFATETRGVRTPAFKTSPSGGVPAESSVLFLFFFEAVGELLERCEAIRELMGRWNDTDLEPKEEFRPEKMSASVALLCTSLLVLLPLGAGVPLSVETMKSNVKLMAQTTIIRIQKLTEEFRISPNMVFSGLELIPDIAPDKPSEGLTSIAQNLHTFQVILSNLPMDGMAQIRSDIQSLRAIVRSLASSFGCPLHKPGSDGRLDAFLKTSSTFHVTIGNVALDRLQRFLSKLVKNLDQLKSC
ncbi:hypothetical protein SKAU_G00043980 [Synaphobranchus kaupii]|uniref:Leptin n=1 Tax=Synaphobranchus kaupii TaxID=118154 RepID=A0A9Q1J8S3_SYNKA|nr:hypothetical protein SKAU_G00043980 [Synaphobranchus kaupii]